MKRRLLDLLRCPVCRDTLDLHVISEAEEEVSRPIGDGRRCATFCAMHRAPLAGRDDRPARFDCRSCYGRDVREGLLVCGGCKLSYPIVAGVPRVIRNAREEYPEFFHEHRDAIAHVEGQEEAARRLGRPGSGVFHRRSNESFSLQWEKYQYQDKTWFKDDQDLRRREFLYGLDLREDQLRDALLLDAGCGNGRLTASVSRYGGEVVGMDLSRSVERAEENRRATAGEHAPFVHFVQGNVLEPPLASSAFDHIHTSGVLHHTPDPEGALRSFLSLGKPGGRAYVQLYRTREAWVGLPNRFLRFFTCRMPVRWLYRLCYAMVPAHTALVLIVAWFRGERSPIRRASRRERAVSMFDHFSPRYQFRYRPEQVRGMYEAAGLRNIKDVTLANEARHMVAFVGDKP